jgi:hypothetical protein
MLEGFNSKLVLILVTNADKWNLMHIMCPTKMFHCSAPYTVGGGSIPFNMDYGLWNMEYGIWNLMAVVYHLQQLSNMVIATVLLHQRSKILLITSKQHISGWTK